MRVFGDDECFGGNSRVGVWTNTSVLELCFELLLQCLKNILFKWLVIVLFEYYYFWQLSYLGKEFKVIFEYEYYKARDDSDYYKGT